VIVPQFENINIGNAVEYFPSSTWNKQGLYNSPISQISKKVFIIKSSPEYAGGIPGIFLPEFCPLSRRV
jgi:hypothetical protein